MNDHDRLSSVLKTWKHEPSPAPGFPYSVWSRISAEAAAPAPVSANVSRFPFPLSLAASFTVLLAVLAGAGAGLAFNHSRTTDYMAASYVRSIDPFQMTAPASPHTHS
ncbi:MAG TPA: hypothetical protein VL357_08165 [Rariglobus sp.]|jgi:hypothetical protein|nr:hypothetical protein [Rariglobus sp.]